MLQSHAEKSASYTRPNFSICPCPKKKKGILNTCGQYLTGILVSKQKQDYSVSSHPLMPQDDGLKGEMHSQLLLNTFAVSYQQSWLCCLAAHKRDAAPEADFDMNFVACWNARV